MSMIQSFSTLRETQREAKSITRDQEKTHYVLRKDGDTDIYRYAKNGHVVREREAGWITLGNEIDLSDTPCIIFP